MAVCEKGIDFLAESAKGRQALKMGHRTNGCVDMLWMWGRVKVLIV